MGAAPSRIVKDGIMIEKVRQKIREIKDFPKPGIGFKDIIPVLQDPPSFRFVIDRMSEWIEKMGAEVVVGIESRGFIFAAPVAYRLNLALSLIRKKGKLPFETICVKAPNEYAVEYFEMHTDGIIPGKKAVIIDDLIATGSSSIAAIDLVKKLKGEVTGFAALVDLAFLGGVNAIQSAHADVDVLTMITFEE
jgi:adenine phosphoribosyltransferase